MNNRVLPSPTMQIVFVSREESNCPLIAEMVRLGHSLLDLGVAQSDPAVISLDYGKRLLITAKNVDAKTMSRQDVVEIVEYDPLKNIMMVIGSKDPCLEAPVHWMVQKARADINALLQVNSLPLVQKLQDTMPTTETGAPPTMLDQAKDILKTMRNRKSILLREKGLLCGGVNTTEIHTTLITLLGGTP
ncbi:MAG: hypothetical protein JXA00_02070 [Candidatus Thermoplasmatota archaeon]|nr:hypothetical protein [Candidatus Thermoplasmatota archaeon]